MLIGSSMWYQVEVLNAIDKEMERRDHGKGAK